MITKARVMAKILVVDDEPDAVELVEFNLKSAGYEVVSAADGSEALKKARAHSPDMIVLDLMLPEVDGLEVCKILRRDPATSAIPIIMLTAKAAEIDRVLGRRGRLPYQAFQPARTRVASEKPAQARAGRRREKGALSSGRVGD